MPNGAEERDDIEKWLSDQSKKPKESFEKKPFRAGRNDEEDMEEKIGDMLKGGHIIEMKGKGAGMLKKLLSMAESGGSGSTPNPKVFASKLDGVINTIEWMADQLNLKRGCKDCNGVDLAVGDILSVPGGAEKTVLKVGYGYCDLSHTSDQKRSDGTWFESEIKKMHFIKK